MHQDLATQSIYATLHLLASETLSPRWSCLSGFCVPRKWRERLIIIETRKSSWLWSKGKLMLANRLASWKQSALITRPHRSHIRPYVRRGMNDIEISTTNKVRSPPFISPTFQFGWTLSITRWENQLIYYHRQTSRRFHFSRINKSTILSHKQTATSRLLFALI